ncbi:MAG: NfeD family protein [Bacteroidales bacterium]|nr:NfeD family protein [Bacteroidales bacterium]
MKVLWGITLTASLIFLIQTIATFLGADAGDSDFDASFDTDIDAGADASYDGHSGMNLYTFRNFVNFFLGFGWTSVLMAGKISSTGLLFFIAAIIGVILVAIVMYLFKWLSTMQQSGTINIYKSAIGCQGTVYLTIPGERQGEGKVQITINNAVREYYAQTDGDTIKTGKPIKVTEVINEHTLLVEELVSLII